MQRREFTSRGIQEDNNEENADRLNSLKIDTTGGRKTGRCEEGVSGRRER
jgi:hypothetical protein